MRKFDIEPLGARGQAVDELGWHLSDGIVAAGVADRFDREVGGV